MGWVITGSLLQPLDSHFKVSCNSNVLHTFVGFVVLEQKKTVEGYPNHLIKSSAPRGLLVHVLLSVNIYGLKQFDYLSGRWKVWGDYAVALSDFEIRL